MAEADFLEMFARIQNYLEVTDEHVATITRMHADGVISQESMETELAWFAGFKEQLQAALELIATRISGQ